MPESLYYCNQMLKTAGGGTLGNSQNMEIKNKQNQKEHYLNHSMALTRSLTLQNIEK